MHGQTHGVRSVAGGAQPRADEASDGNWPGTFLAARTPRATITLVLCVGALMVLLGPCRYCMIDRGRAELADLYRHRSHGGEQDAEGDCHTCLVPPGSHHAAPPLQVSGNYVAEVVTGGISGLLMTLAVVLGGIGADIPGRGIFAMGTASLAGYSISLGFSTFLVESAKEEFAMSQLEEERKEVRSMPEAEIAEMTCHYRKRGISDGDAQVVAGILSKYEDFWLEHMMAEELGIQLPRGKTAAVSAGVATFASLLFCGALPLLGVASSVALGHLRGPSWYRPQFATYIALALSATMLLLLGVFVSRAAGSRTPIVNGMLMLLNGCGTALLAFSMSQACLSLYQPGSIDTPPAGRQPDRFTRRPSQQLVNPDTGSPTSTAAEAAAHAAATGSLAWPSFRDMFLRGLCGLGVGVCAFIVCIQAGKRMGYDSLRVFLYGWLTCITTGLGALPFMFISCESIGEQPLAVANAVAGGMMLAASGSMLVEAHEQCGPMDWQILVGLLVGALFIRFSESLHSSGDDEEEPDVLALHCAFVERRHLRKAMLIFTVMFCHSAAEGIAVGVAFSRQLREEFGLYVSLLLAVHNVPEGLAVALVLVPRGVSAPLAALIATLTSVPQPLLAVASFLFVDSFSFLLPLGLAFAAGAMVYLCLHELLREAAQQLGWSTALMTTTASFCAMCVAIFWLQELTGH